MQTTRSSAALFSIVTVLGLGACSGGGGGGGTPTTTPGPEFPVAVPAGSGALTIQMAGVWEIRDVVLVDTNSSTPNLPPEGTEFVLESNRIASIGGLSVAPGFLELILGLPLVTYVNQLDGRTMLYAVTADGRIGGGTREQVALAGGSVDDNTIALEVYTSTQRAVDPDPSYTVVRYLLSRIGTTVPAPLELDPETPLGDAERAELRRRIWSVFGR